ncbi:hypothetical protein SeMB42_g03816 [Synchytrium endobioticum]|uniref:Uncharacterized protein n=1 Tax=Synchytrium endobioticum TaxID=286115 RepID=A0A507D3X6_9FUNG|nr:hypothetical protein SeMB42_g03816 [Synchytrium endobioticum]TPX49422.1 hypothetical protein SeLEV6574_g01482 [Synchytrium endobioticum]
MVPSLPIFTQAGPHHKPAPWTITQDVLASHPPAAAKTSELASRRKTARSKKRQLADVSPTQPANSATKVVVGQSPLGSQGLKSKRGKKVTRQDSDAGGNASDDKGA